MTSKFNAFEATDYRFSTVTRTAGNVESDPLDRYRAQYLPRDAALAPGVSAAERNAFRQEAQTKLSDVVGSLEEGRDRMQSLHALVKAGSSSTSKEYADTFKQATEAYQRAVEKAAALLYERDSEGFLKPNRFYKNVEAERQQLRQEMERALTSDPAKYGELSKQYAMLDDVLRAEGFAYANYGLALLRSSVYLPGDQRDSQTSKANDMLMLAARFDPKMVGETNVPGDPNFKKHYQAIMAVVNATAYRSADAPTTQLSVPAPPPFISTPISEVVTTTSTSLPATDQGAERIVITPEMTAKVAPLDNLGNLYLGAKAAFEETASLRRFATTVKLLRDFDKQVKDLQAKGLATPEAIAKAQEVIFRGDESFGPQANPKLAENIPAFILKVQESTFGSNRALDALYNPKVRPNLADEIQLDAAGNLKALPPSVRDRFAQAEQAIQATSPQQLADMVATQKLILQANLDALVSRPEQEKIKADMAALQASFDQATRGLDLKFVNDIASAYGQITQAKQQLIRNYLLSNPQFQTELQAIVSSTPASSDAQQQAVNALTSKYTPQVLTNPQYQSDLKTIEDQILNPLRSINPNVEPVLLAQKAIEDFMAGKDGSANQTEDARIKRAGQVVAVLQKVPTILGDLDAISHMHAVVQGYVARGLVLSGDSSDQERAAQLISLSMQDNGAAPYLTPPEDVGEAARQMGPAYERLEVMAPFYRQLDTLSHGYLGAGSGDALAASTQGIATGFSLSPKYSQAQIDAATARGDSSLNGLVRDGSSIAAYAGTRWGLQSLGLVTGKTLLNRIGLGFVVPMLFAGAASDLVEDGRLDGPFSDPGGWARGAGVSVLAHGAYERMLGSYSTAATARLIEQRATQLGGQTALEAVNAGKGFWSKAWQKLPDTYNAFAQKRILGYTLPEAEIAAANATELLAMQRRLGAMQSIHTLQTAIGVGAGSQGLKILDGEVHVDSFGQAGLAMLSSGMENAALTITVVPMLNQFGRLPLWGLNKIPGIKSVLASEVATTVGTVSKVYATELWNGGGDWLKSRDMQRAAEAASNPQDLAKAISRIDPTLSDAQARAKAMMLLQQRRGLEVRAAQQAQGVKP